jgi:hypothetical protein
MVIDFAVLEQIKNLRRTGPHLNEQLTKNIGRIASAALPQLIELATDLEGLHKLVPECYAPMHALRLLGEFGTAEIVKPLLNQFPIKQVMPNENLVMMWIDEVPQMIGRLGEAALPELWSVLDDASQSIEARGMACASLPYVTLFADEARQSIITGLHERLLASEDNQLTAHYIWALGYLGAGEVYSDILTAFRQNKVELKIVTAAQARQLLLSKEATARLKCGTHTLLERYQQHPLLDPSEAQR